ncbi:MAG: dihydrodipicolinate synthase family protein, partial [Pseudomonadota bacterium]
MAEDRSSAVPQGLVVPMLTPFEADGSIASDLFIAHAKHLLAQGAAGLAPFGTTGEALSVGINARISSIDRLLDHGISPDFLIPGTGLTSLDDTANLSRAMLDRSVRAVMVLPPFYYKNVSNQGIITYFTRLIERLGEDARIVLYHIPKVAMVGFGVDVVQHLKARFPDQILAIKDSSGDWSNMQALMGIDGLHVYPGSERNLP